MADCQVCKLALLLLLLFKYVIVFGYRAPPFLGIRFKTYTATGEKYTTASVDTESWPPNVAQTSEI